MHRPGRTPIIAAAAAQKTRPRPRTLAAIGIALVLLAYPVVYVQWMAAVKRAAGTADCPDAEPGSASSDVAPDISIVFTPPHVQCTAAGTPPHDYWLSPSIALFTLGVLTLLCAGILCLRRWRAS